MNKLKFALLITSILSATNLLQAIDTSTVKDLDGATLITALASSSIDFDPKNCQEVQAKGLAIYNALKAYAMAKLHNVGTESNCALNDELNDFLSLEKTIDTKLKAIHQKTLPNEIKKAPTKHTALKTSK